MIVEPFVAFAPLPALITSTVDVFTLKGAFTVTTGRSPAPSVTVTSSNLSVDAPAGVATASGAAHTASRATPDARTARRRRTRGILRRGGGDQATGGFDPLGRGGTQHACRREHQTIRFAPGRTRKRGPASSRAFCASTTGIGRRRPTRRCAARSRI